MEGKESTNVNFEGIELSYGILDDEKSLSVSLTGYLDTINSTKISPHLSDITNSIKGLRKIVLNLEKLTYASSTGIGAMTSLLITCKQKEIELELINVNRKIIDVIALLGFTSFFKIRSQ